MMKKGIRRIICALLVLSLCMTSGFCVPGVSMAAAETGGYNLAYNRPVTASAQYPTMPASKLTDGDESKDTGRWSSEAAPPQWAYVDLGSSKTMNRFRLVWESDGEHATDYNIYVSDSPNNWGAAVVQATGHSGRESDHTLDSPVKGRYVKIEVTEVSNYQNVSCCEFQIYGDSPAEPEEQDPAENVALRKTAYASDVEDNDVTNLGPQKVTDGARGRSNRWASGVDGDANDTSATHKAHWIYVDLGKKMNVQVVKVFWWERKATDYCIQLSDDAQDDETAVWETVAAFTSQPSSKEQKIVLDEVHQARYVRLLISEYDGQDPDSSTYWNNISVEEIEVYGGIVETRPTMSEILDMITVAPPKKGDETLEVTLPEEAAEKYNYTVTYNGTDFEQVVDDQLHIYQPVSDKQVKVSFKVVDNEAETVRGKDPSESVRNYAFREISVTIPGQYEAEDGDNEAPVILPELAEWKGQTGRFTPGSNAKIVYADAELADMANAMANDYQDLTGGTLQVVQGSEDQAEEGDFYFALTRDTAKGLQDEGYLMEVGDTVKVEAETERGAYWGTRTILQSLKQTGDIPQGIARDYPLYKVRGFILDVARKPFTLNYLKEIVQQMAWYKLNDLEVHLNDNLISLEHYTTEEEVMQAYSAFRLESDIKKGDGANQADLTSTDLYYTKEEFREFIKESRIYGVDIVPEIDTPAHSLALTKVRPDLRLGTRGRENDHLDLKNQYDECISFVKSIWDEYLDGTDPVFDADTTLMVGADEYSADQNAYVRFSEDMLRYVEDTGRKARIWGSLTVARKSGADVSQVAAVSKGAQVNLWNSDYANIDEMYELGFDLINCNDGNYYIVPAAGYYYDKLYDSTLYDLSINTISGFTVPAGDKQMIGGAFAVWNDMTDYLENGISEYDVYFRVENAVPLFGAKLWGKGGMSLADANEARSTLGDAPGTNFGYVVDSQDECIVNYPMDTLEDTSANRYDLTEGENASIQQVDSKNALQLNGGESYVNTPLETVGLGNDLRVKVKRTSYSTEEQILFESSYGTIKAVQKGTGKVGFSREKHDYSFNYELPVNEWVELEFKNQKDVTALYVNGKEVDVLGDRDVTEAGKDLHATMMYPFARIGSLTNAFTGYVDDLRLGETEAFSSTMELDYEVGIAEFILERSDNAELRAAVEEARELFKQYRPDGAQIEEVLAKLRAIIEDTAYARADYRKVNGYLGLVPEDLSIFTSESVQSLRLVIDSIRYNLSVTMQDIVDGYANGLEKALASLELRPVGDVHFIESERLTVTACSYQHDGSDPENAIDGNPATMWHTDWTELNLPHWIAFELDKPARINGITYLPRENLGNGTLRQYDVQVSDDGKEWRTITSGTLTWGQKQEEREIEFDTVETKFIRLMFIRVVGQNGSAAEIKIRKADVAADIAGLQALIDKAEKMEDTGYTEESWATLQQEIQDAKALLSSENPDATAVETQKRELTEAIAKLQLSGGNKGVDKNGLYKAILNAEELPEENYTAESYAALEAALAEAEKVLNNPDALQEDVDQVLETLENAVDALEPKPVDFDFDIGGTFAVETPAVQPENGSVSTDVSSAGAGAKVTITVAPKEGYITGSVTVTAANGSPVTVTKNDDGTYTFTMPSSKVSVDASFVTPGTLFSDLNDDGWYRNAVAFAINRGVMNGTAADAFTPNGATTRGMITAILYRLEGRPDAGEADFTDVDSNLYYAKAIGWAEEHGIVTGCGDGTFAPNGAITREQLALMLWRYAGEPAADGNLSGYPDAADVSAWARQAMVWAVENEIVRGSDSKLVPGGDASRAQVAAMIMRYCEKFGK